MPHPDGVVRIVMELRAARTNLVNQFKDVNAALAGLGNLDDGSHYSKPRRRWSALSRKRLTLARNARWAKARSGLQPEAKGLTLVKRTIPVAGRNRIDAAAPHAS